MARDFERFGAIWRDFRRFQAISGECADSLQFFALE
jgi:hypothetical protein